MNRNIIVASVLFGAIHPGSKFILELGIPLIEFCILYIGLRLFFQIPLFLKNYSKKSVQKYPWILLVFFGVVGAFLQVSEFFSLSKGLDVATVTFLVYSHPVWALFLSYYVNKEKIGKYEMLRAFIGIIGILLVSEQALKNGESYYSLRILAPIFAGFLIALWSSLSNKLSKAGVKPIDMSFLYDVFALISLIFYSYLNGNIIQSSLTILHWVSVPFNSFCVLIFSIIFGLLPNYLFYKGSKQSTNLNASLLLLFEPVIGTIIAIFLFGETKTIYFAFGAVLILCSGLNLINKNNIDSTFKKAIGILPNRT